MYVCMFGMLGIFSDCFAYIEIKIYMQTYKYKFITFNMQAGIIFLGDFWHVRGSLSVELLNRVLKCLKEWTQPVIMIPGNHDQVSRTSAYIHCKYI